MTACGGSGGGVDLGAGGTPTETKSTTWAEFEGKAVTLSAATSGTIGLLSDAFVSGPGDNATVTIIPAASGTASFPTLTFAIDRDGVTFNQTFDAADEAIHAERFGTTDTYTWMIKDSGPARTSLLLLHNPATTSDALQSAAFGLWGDHYRENEDAGSFGAFAVGFETGTNALPTTTLTFRGRTIGALETADAAYFLEGRATLTANFPTGRVGAVFDQMQATEMSTFGEGPQIPWNDFAANATISGNHYFGAAFTTTNTALTWVPLTGNLSGTFYGATAGETAGVWKLSGDGFGALGSFGGKVANLPQVVVPPPVGEGGGGTGRTCTTAGSCPTLWDLNSGSLNGVGLKSTLAVTTFRASDAVAPTDPTVHGLGGDTDNMIAVHVDGDRAFRARVGSPPSWPDGGTHTYISRVGPSVKNDNDPETNAIRLTDDTTLYLTRNMRVWGGVSQVLAYDPAGDPLLDYATYGAWVFENDINGQTYLTTGAQAAGMITSVSALPSGTLTYVGSTTGYHVEADGDFSAFTGSTSVTANFGTAKVSGGFFDLGLQGGGSLPSATFQGNMTGNTYRGSVQAAGGYLGSIEGAFYGPGAVETAGSWSLRSGTTGDALVGAFGAAR